MKSTRITKKMMQDARRELADMTFRNKAAWEAWNSADDIERERRKDYEKLLRDYQIQEKLTVPGENEWKNVS